MITELKYLQGVGPQRETLLEKELGIKTLRDLLYYFPYRYVDRSKIFHINELTPSTQYVQMKGRMSNFHKQGEGRTARLTAVFTDGTGTMELTWFKGMKFVESRYMGRSTTEYYVFGKPTFFGGKYSIVHPEVDETNQRNDVLCNGLQSQYNTTEKMKKALLNTKAMQKIMLSALGALRQSPFPETLPQYILEKYRFMNVNVAVSNMHFPESLEKLENARTRLKFDELFYVQLNILSKKLQRERNQGGFVFSKIGPVFNDFYQNHLPFQLTNAQKRVLKEIRADVGSGKQMNRLLQGDVGSGKTLVALMSMLMAVDNGYQACLMAPTEILATQHYQGLSQLLEGTSVRVELLTGSTKKKQRDEIHTSLMDKSLHILIGTHALIEDTVQFANLGLVVIDEQHRFGVEQRARLWQKNTQPPHVLVMTATPIPRTLAMTIYGDLRVSVIDELPPGRKPVQTVHYFDNKRNNINTFLRKQMQDGRQVYIVYPLIQESEKMDLRNLEEGYEEMKKVFPEYTICMVHGKMKPQEKDAEMARFVSGEAQMMVATTVIEVGVNVPNATVMVIENANRFGLSQLHQLRGRVGRGADQSYCILMSPYKLSDDTRKRLSIMTTSNDGFEIAEADLKMRGPGDMDGTVQSGLPFDLKVASLARDGAMLEFARRVAVDVLSDDPTMAKPENAVLLRQLALMKKVGGNWGEVS